MKLLIVADASSIHTRRWAHGLASKGIEIGIFTLKEPNPEDYKDYPQIQIETFFQDNKLFHARDGDFSKATYLKALPALKKFIKKFKPDIVHAYYASSYGFLAALTFFKPFYVSIWGSDVYLFPKQGLLQKFIFQWVLFRADKIFSTSHAMKNEALQYGDWDIQVIPFGVDTNQFKSTRPIFSEQVITIGTIKSLEDIYGIDRLIDAYAELKKVLPHQKFRLLLIGSGSQKEKYIQQAKDLGVYSDLTIAENIPRSEIPNWINKLDVAVFPSRSESFGVAVLECMACERLVVVNNVGGLPEVIANYPLGDLVDLEKQSLSSIIGKNIKRDFRLNGNFGPISNEFIWENCLNRAFDQMNPN